MTNETMCILILIAVCVIILLYLLWRIKKDGLREVVTDLIVYAEAEYGSGKGKEKMDWVIDSITKLIPKPFNFFITDTAIKKFAQSVFDSIKTALDYRGPIDRQDP